MLKWTVLTVCLMSLLGCSRFSNYDVSVDDPTRKERSYEEPYTSHPQRRVLYPH